MTYQEFLSGLKFSNIYHEIFWFIPIGKNGMITDGLKRLYILEIDKYGFCVAEDNADEEYFEFSDCQLIKD
jgi:hypothetical protein